MTPAEAYAAHNTGITRARAAYNADQAVANGTCAVCQRTPKDGHMRRCSKCRRAKKREKP